MRLLILFAALVVLASCSNGGNASNSNSGAVSPNQPEIASRTDTKPTEPCLNLNVATANELIRLRGIGEVIAARIIDYRKRHGRFRRPQELIIIEGFSERKYRAIADLICVQ